jgi:hypothetical protein
VARIQRRVALVVVRRRRNPPPQTTKSSTPSAEREIEIPPKKAKNRCKTQRFFCCFKLVFNGERITNDEVFDEVIDFGFGFTEDLIPLEGIHSAEEGFPVYGEVIAIGERDLTGILGGNRDEAIDFCHGIKSDFVTHWMYFLSDAE